MLWFFHIKLKSDIRVVLINFSVLVKTQFNSSVQTIKNDNSSEFVNVECYKLFTNLGNIHQRTCIHTHQKNGIAERKDKLEIARAIKFQGTYL